MQFVRKIMDSRFIEEIIILPEELRNKKVEILVLPLNENEGHIREKEIFKPEDFEGILKTTNLQEEIKIIRDEWERN